MVGILSWSAGLPLGPVLSNEPQYQHQVVGNDYCFPLEIKCMLNIMFFSLVVNLADVEGFWVATYNVHGVYIIGTEGVVSSVCGPMSRHRILIALDRP